jgi:hypothetical protein
MKTRMRVDVFFLEFDSALMVFLLSVHPLDPAVVAEVPIQGGLVVDVHNVGRQDLLETLPGFGLGPHHTVHRDTILLCAQPRRPAVLVELVKNA